MTNQSPAEAEPMNAREYQEQTFGPNVNQGRPNKTLDQAIGLLRQWLNEERIHYGKMVTNEELHHWLDGAVNQALLQKIEEAMPKRQSLLVNDMKHPAFYSYTNKLQYTLQELDAMIDDVLDQVQHILNQAREGKL